MNLSVQPTPVATLITMLTERGLPYDQALVEAWKEHLSQRAGNYDDLANDPQQRARFVLGTTCSNLAEPVGDLHKVARLLGAEVPADTPRHQVLDVIAEAFLGWYA